MTDALAIRTNTTPVPSPDDFNTMFRMAGVLVKSGFLPDSIKTPEQAVAVWQKGRELGLEPMQSYGNIHVIKGKPTCSAELMRALIWRDHGDAAFQITEETDQQCVIACQRPGWKTAVTVTFTMQDAKTADLLGNPTWKKYPAAMLKARATSKAANSHFSDSIMGLKLPDELGAPVMVNAEGEVKLLEVTDAGVSGGYVAGASIHQTLEAPASPSPLVHEKTTRDGTVVDTRTGVILKDAPPKAESKAEFNDAINRWLELTGNSLTKPSMNLLGEAAGVTRQKWTDEDKATIVAYVASLPTDAVVDAEVVSTDDDFSF